MSQFFGVTVKPNDPVAVNPGDHGEDIELNITGATVKSGGIPGKTSFLYIQADDGDHFALAALVPGAREHQRLELQLGAGNEKIVFSVRGGATIDVSGYIAMTETYAIESSDDEDEEDVASGARPLAKTKYGTALLVESSSSDDSDADDEESKGSNSEDEDDFGVQPVLSKRKAPPAAATPKPKKAATAAATVAASGPDEAFKESIRSYLTANGASPLSKVGSACKRPAGVKAKLKSFIKEHQDIFHLDNDKVNLV
mmetsp:Transcript_15302/g.45702  ORF Transcript_15302/g.45702 Transcript_15302/m.45702 type:complete len:256 (-) Transcript_15302:23-790(-)